LLLHPNSNARASTGKRDKLLNKQQKNFRFESGGGCVESDRRRSTVGNSTSLTSEFLLQRHDLAANSVSSAHGMEIATSPIE
jgi:hypothetical protein